ncbi:flagellar hook protein FlgE [Aeromonas diversa CDC 2478-85]|uniref:Flagellar hook protein FlgE n=1 Tax=Aeromonas diversa CDC 2478-85 TaxID=1268237 RepID=N9VJ32_9GAMM|nr:flagellar hook protein FlgE [Aeromonas diversa]ENY71411.1 flagellar hook protein FlgE [Aeromonas diversa CDC 2478-85]
MSFNIGLSGLRAVNQELSVISNNVANASTAGFKASRAEFAAIYSGGQAGGVEVANVSQNFDRKGDVLRSGRPLDMAISGNGFFVLKDANGQTSYTRAGMFRKDADNYLVSNISGKRLQGYGIGANGQLQTGVVGDIQVSSASLAAKPSDKLEFVGNLKADASKITVTPFDPNKAETYNFSQSSKVYDSLGIEHSLTQYFVKTGDNAWQINYTFDGKVMETGTPAAALSTPLKFKPDGTIDFGTPAVLPPKLDLAPPGADPIKLEVDLSKLSQYGSDFNVTRNQSNGYGAGELTGVSVDDKGGVYAMFTNGQRLQQGQVVMANFTNPDGLMQSDNTSWVQTFSSGQPVMGAPGTGTLGSLATGGYESSNVDISSELVGLMTAQRNYQANAKSISSADKMTQVLFNSF